LWEAPRDEPRRRAGFSEDEFDALPEPDDEASDETSEDDSDGEGADEQAA
jgi:hypothetical protein